MEVVGEGGGRVRADGVAVVALAASHDVDDAAVVDAVRVDDDAAQRLDDGRRQRRPAALLQLRHHRAHRRGVAVRRQEQQPLHVVRRLASTTKQKSVKTR